MTNAKFTRGFYAGFIAWKRSPRPSRSPEYREGLKCGRAADANIRLLHLIEMVVREWTDKDEQHLPLHQYLKNLFGDKNHES